MKAYLEARRGVRFMAGGLTPMTRRALTKCRRQLWL
jgi:hypothetical protein